MHCHQGKLHPWNFLILGLGLISFGLHAAVPVDHAAQEQLQQERSRALRDALEIQPDIRLHQTPAAIPDTYPDSESPCFKISQITLQGEAAAQFQFALTAVTHGEAAATGHCLGAQGINLVMTHVQNAILARGYVTTRVLAAPQNLESGELQLTVIPGKVRHVRFANGVTIRATKWNAVRYAQATFSTCVTSSKGWKISSAYPRQKWTSRLNRLRPGCPAG